MKAKFAMRFTVVLEREQDGGFIATVPTLPGCVSQGDTRDEAMKNVREAIEVHIEDCRASGDSIPSESGREFIDIDAA